MTTENVTAASGGSETRNSSALFPLFLMGLAAVSLAVIAVSLWQVGAGYAKQSCIAEAVAKFPAVPVSAYNGSATGPLKLSFTAERQKAVDSCS